MTVRRPATAAAGPRDRTGPSEIFGGVAGLFLGLTLMKFGNPPILGALVAVPKSPLELLIEPWPVAWSYVLLGAVAVFGLFVAQWRLPSPRWPALLPLAWFGWQLVSAPGTVDGRLTWIVLPHFAALLAAFYLGLLALAPVRRLTWFWLGLLAGLAFVLWSGLEQHYGGLEATRRYIYSQPGWQHLPPEQLKRIGSNRIFATLLYPNTLAGVLLLLLPALTLATWQLGARLPRLGRLLATALLGWAGLACLYWSGSKAGWLIALALATVALLRLDFSRKLKRALVAVVLIGGVAAFAVKFAPYFARGATSVSARMDYWHAGWQTFLENPVRGSGPGTFSVCYRRIKPPEAEMALLAHNDYLEQASDSGLPGAVLFAAFVAVSLVRLHRRCAEDWLRFAVWLGLLGWALQSFVEFGLYIPAVGWVAFWFLGWLWGLPELAVRNGSDKSAAPV